MVPLRTHTPATLSARAAGPWPPALLVCLALLTLAACDREAPSPTDAGSADYVRLEEEVMGTVVGVTVPAGESAAADGEVVFAVFREVDARMSEWKQSSPLSEVNRRAGGEAVPVPEDLRQVLRRAKEIAEQTGGAFDPTWAALWGLWDFRAGDPRVPSPAEVEERAGRVDWRKLEIDDEAGTVRLAAPGMLLGLGAIAKGYALDRAAEALRERGVKSFLLVAGGQVYAGGERRTATGSRPWRVGIRDPRGPAEDFFAWLDLADASASTSGDYESFFEVEGVRYHHVLDPRTGWPAKSGLTSVTVVSPDATLADALSTAFLVSGPDVALELAAELEDVEVVLVDEAGEWRATPGVEGRLEVRHPPTPARRFLPTGAVR